MNIKRIFCLTLVFILLLIPSCNNNFNNQGSAEESKETETEHTIDVPEVKKYNLALGKKYTVDCKSFRTDNCGDADDYRGKVLRNKLTDGLKASEGKDDNICAYNGNTVEIIVDLGGTFAVDSMTIDIFGAGGIMPKLERVNVKYYTSTDGDHFIPYDISNTGYENVEKTDINKWQKGLFKSKNECVKASYVKINITTGGAGVRLSEVEIIGSEISLITTLTGVPSFYIDEISDKANRFNYVDCTVTFIDPSERSMDLTNEKSTIRIRGKSSSIGQKSPYNIKFEEKKNLMGMGLSKKWALIANMYDKSLLRNKLSYDMAIDVGLSYAQKSEFVHVFYNGEYQGLYLLCIPVSVSKDSVNIDPLKNEFLFEFEVYTGISYSKTSEYITPINKIILGCDDDTIPTLEQKNYLDSFFYKFESALQQQNFDEVCKYIDIDSFIDVYIINELFKQVDYSVSSTRFYIKNGKLFEGPVWDFDLSSGNVSPGYYKSYYKYEGENVSYKQFWCRGIWNDLLFKMDEFNKKFKERYNQLQPNIINLYSSNELGQCKIDALAHKNSSGIRFNYDVWDLKKNYSVLSADPVDGTYLGEMNFLKDWLKNRNEWILSEINKKPSKK